MITEKVKDLIREELGRAQLNQMRRFPDLFDSVLKILLPACGVFVKQAFVALSKSLIGARLGAQHVAIDPRWQFVNAHVATALRTLYFVFVFVVVCCSFFDFTIEATIREITRCIQQRQHCRCFQQLEKSSRNNHNDSVCCFFR